MACAVRTTLLSHAAVKVYRKVSITNGRRTSWIKNGTLYQNPLSIACSRRRDARDTGNAPHNQTNQLILEGKVVSRDGFEPSTY